MVVRPAASGAAQRSLRQLPPPMDGVVPRDASPSSPARPPSPSHSLTGEVVLLSIAEVPPPPHLANNCAAAAQCGLRPAASLNNVAELAGDDLARSWPQLRDGTRSLPVTTAPAPPARPRRWSDLEAPARPRRWSDLEAPARPRRWSDLGSSGPSPIGCATLRGRAGVIRCATCGERLVPTIDGKRPCRVCAGEMPPAADAPRTPHVPRRPVKWREPSDVSPVARDVIARVYKATRDTPGS